MKGNEEMKEEIEFIEWMREDNLILIGIREMVLEGKGKKRDIVEEKEKIGIMGDNEVSVMRKDDEDNVKKREIKELIDREEKLIVKKENQIQQVNRC